MWCSTQQGCERVREGGEVTRTIPHGLFGFSCALGGLDGRTLFMVAAEWNGYENIGKGPRTGRVLHRVRRRPRHRPLTRKTLLSVQPQFDWAAWIASNQAPSSGTTGMTVLSAKNGA